MLAARKDEHFQTRNYFLNQIVSYQQARSCCYTKEAASYQFNPNGLINEIKTEGYRIDIWVNIDSE